MLALYLTAPGCGTKNSDGSGAAAVAPVPCPPGQICAGGVGGVAQGIPLLNAPAFGSLSNQGSALQITVAAPALPQGGAPTQVNVAGTLHLVPGDCFGLPPGDFVVSGQGTWVNGFGGSDGGVSSMLTINAPMGAAQAFLAGGQFSMATIHYGVDPLFQNPPNTYYIWGTLQVPACGRTFIIQ